MKLSATLAVVMVVLVATAVSKRALCQANFYARQGSVSCTQCPSGTSSPKGARKCRIGVAGRVENYVDYWGADIRSFKSKGVKDCYESCVRQRGCVAFSMRKKDNRCWLKNKKNGKKRKTGKSDRLSGNIKKLYRYQTLYANGYWGDWGQWNYCPNGGFATSFKQKVERNQGGGDDSALNGICLICNQGGVICSKVGPWGSWRTSRTRLSGFDAFKMKSEKKQGSGDDSGANALRLYNAISSYVYKTSNEGKWGKWGTTKQCKSGRVICGIRTQVERKRGSGDDTALNGVQFTCCS